MRINTINRRAVHRGCLLLLLAGWGVPAGDARAQDSVRVGETARLRELVSSELPRLAADSRADRLQAEERLLEAGPALLEFLPAPDTVEDAATREALRRICTQLEQQAAAAFVQPGRVTLQGRMTVADILHEISEQTANPVLLQDDVESTSGIQLDIDYEAVPFWDALADLAYRLDLNVSVASEQRSTVLVPPGDDPPLAVATAAAFRIKVRDLRSRGRVVALDLTVTGEPRLRPLFLSWSDSDFSARTSSARSLSPLSPEARRELPAVDRGPVRFSVVFETAESRELPTAVTGEMVVTTAALTRQFRFRDLIDTGRDAQRHGGVTVTRRDAEFSTTRRGVRRAEIELSVVYDTGGPAFESHRTWVYHNEVFLEAPDGTQLPVNDGFETLGEQDGAVAVRYRFRDLPEVPPEDWQLVYHAPTAVVDVPVQFDVDLTHPRP